MLQTAKLKQTLTVSDEHKQLSAVTGHTSCQEEHNWDEVLNSVTLLLFYILSTETHALAVSNTFLGHHWKNT